MSLATSIAPEMAIPSTLCPHGPASEPTSPGNKLHLGLQLLQKDF